MHKFADFLDKPFTKETKRQFLDFLQNDFLKGSFKPVFDKDWVVADYVSWLSFIKQVNILWSADNLKDLIVLEIIKRNDIWDSRIWLTKEIFKLIANKDFLNKPRFNVLAIVRWEEPSKTWRFSLITSDWDKKSSPKRFSFLLWEWEKVKTVKKNIIEPLWIKDFDDLVDRFDVEVVRQEFFALYMDLFLELYAEIKDNDTFKELIEWWLIEPISFAKNLMWKMIFLYFIQKKWRLWIKDPNGKFWDWDRDFFKHNFENLAHQWNLFRTSTNFYNDFLEPLFYSWLNKKNEYDWNKQLSMKVPYLNGWLFQEEYDWENTVINLNNSIFKSIIDCFDTYNFTIDEDDPIDREIAVDPEMLWKIFESMISVNSENIDKILESYTKAKKRSKLKELSPDNILSITIWTDINRELWAFYTPREIVKYMTQEALISYLTEKLNKIESWETLDKCNEIIRKLFEYKEKHLSQHEIDEDKVNWYNLIKKHVFDIRNSLKEIKILDPAIWSGAFPMWILQEILWLNRYLIDTFHLDNESDFEIKKQIIQNNIHWIDIDPGAIDIARLRFWLSLIVDSEDPVPLPNLDFKFVCANSLIPLEEWWLFVNEDFIKKLKDIKDKYFSCCDHEEKEKLKKDFMNEKLSLFSIDREWLNSLRWKDGRITESYKKAIADLAQWVADKKNKQLLDWEPFNTQKSNKRFDSKMMFDIDKFDIVIWNPPYVSVRTKNFDVSLKPVYKQKYSLAVGQYDLYTLFIELSNNILDEHGTLAFIIPTRMLSNENFMAAREFVVKNLPIVTYVNAQRPFENAEVEANIMICAKWKEPENVDSFIFNTKTKAFDYLSTISYKAIMLMPFTIFPFVFNNETINLFEKLQKKPAERLEKYLEITRGFECGYNDEAIGSWKYKLIKSEAIYPFFPILEEEIMCSPDFSNITKYKTEDVFLNVPKLLTKFCSNMITFALDEYWYCNTNAVYNCQFKEWFDDIDYLLAVLNSRFTTFRFNTAFLNIDTIFPHIQKNQLEAIPIPIISEDIKNKLASLVEEILYAKRKKPDADVSDLQQQIDTLMYKIYDLTDEEIQIIENSIK